jgi:N-acetyl-1-D-myo-inositol-2-amino-2-deoxy-alpha-D-glucopyranoside deacetylase
MQCALELVEIIRDRKPQVLITYDENGGYGHPDHIKAHRVAMLAAELAADPQVGVGEPWEISKIYWNAIPKSAIKKALTSSKVALRIALRIFKYVPSKWLTLPFVQADSIVTTEIDGDLYRPQKLAALREHKTQLVMNGDLFQFNKSMGIKVSGVEHYILIKGERGAGVGKFGRESSLFN